MKWRVAALVLLVGVPAMAVVATFYGAINIFGDCDPYCNAWQSSPIGNGFGETAIIRREYRGTPDDYDAVPNAVYVHKASESNTNDNLILRYYALEEEASLPVVRWTGRNELAIDVASNSIVQVTRERASIGGITISYRLPQAVCPPTNSPAERPRIGPSCDYSKQLDRFIDSLDGGKASLDAPAARHRGKAYKKA